jgi:hypothetical protein
MINTSNTCIGDYSGYSLTTGKNLILIGDYAGSGLTIECNLTIIGDNITNTKDIESRKDCFVLTYPERTIVIGKKLFGNENPIYKRIYKSLSKQTICEIKAEILEDLFK